MLLDVDHLKVCINHGEVESSLKRYLRVRVLRFGRVCILRHDHLDFRHGEACLLECRSELSK